MKHAYRLLQGVLLCILFSLSAAGQAKWFTTYYATWSMMPLGVTDYALPPWEIDWTGLTHLVLFDNGNITKTAPYWAYMFGPPPSRPSDTESDSVCVEFNGVANPGDGRYPHYLDSLVTIAHRKGVKVVITIQAVNSKNLNYVTADSARTELFITTLVTWAERKHFDGVELDWEAWAAPLPSSQIVNRFIRMLHRRVHTMKTPSGAPGLLMVSAGSGQQDLYSPEQDYMVEQFNLQLYDYVYAWYGKINSNVSWHISPLHKGTVDPTFEGQAYDTRGPLQWVAAGHDPKRIGLGVPTFGYVLRHVDSLFQAIGGIDYGNASYHRIEALKSNGGTEEWDDVRKVRSIRGTALRNEGVVGWGQGGVATGMKFFAVGESPRSLVEKVNWMDANHFGGIMTYDFVSDLDAAQTISSGRRHPLQRAIAVALGLASPVPVEPSEAQATQIVHLQPGWNMVSSYLQPNDSSLSSICGDLRSVGVIVKNGAGSVYWPALSIDAITTWDPRSGYRIYAERETTLTFSGCMINPATMPLQLKQGMNLIPYLRSDSMTLAEAFAGIKDMQLVVVNGANKIYWPAKGIREFVSLEPGAGYMVYVSAPVRLVYPANPLPD
ncbi:MAG TPA: glycoside hydrolase family 18 protein [Bacteroidota bacterium]|nr:glycoside hydrolase family 18 protein [Bacteroidota bacterium]